MKTSKEQEIIKTLFKDFLTAYNSRNISQAVKMSHAGAFKILKKLEKEDNVKAKRIGKAIIYSLNFDNPITQRKIEMALTIEAQSHKRWIEEFKGLEDAAQFIVLFGSILTNEKTARDIDLLVVAQSNNSDKINKIIEKRNKILNKKIHLILQSPEDFKKDIDSKNKVIIEVIKKGIFLFGQERVRRMLGDKK